MEAATKPSVCQLGQRGVILSNPGFNAELFALVLRASLNEGFNFITKLLSEWASGQNCFDEPGEILLGTFLETALVGVCGLNIDPYTTEAGVGRVRHLYVLRNHRNKGIGQQLMGHIIAVARTHFHLLRLRTDNEYAAHFYERLGFQPVSDVDACTHVLNLRK